MNKANATITGNSANVTYNGNDQSVAGFTASGLVNGETAAVLTGVAASGATGKNYGTYTNTVSGTDSNYNLTLVNGTLSVAKAGLTVTGATTNTIYTGQAQTNSVATITGIQGSTDSFTITGYGTATNAGTYADSLVATAVGATQATNYNITYTNGSLAIGKAALTVTADNKTKVYGDTNPTLTATITGYVNGEGSAAITGAPAMSTAATQYSNVASYAITPAVGTLAANNYSFSYTNGALSITAAPLTVTGANATPTYSGLAQTNSAATVSGIKGSADSFTITGYGTGTNAGTYSDNLVAAAGGATRAANYNITYTNGALTIGKANATVTANSANPTYSGQAQSVSGFTATGLVNGETAAVLTGVAASGATGTNAGTYTNTVSGTDSNYNLNLVNGALTIAKANATITGNSANVTYNGNDQSVAGFTASGLVNGETAAVLTGVAASGATGKNYGTYTNTVSGTDSNYNLTLVNGTLSVAKAGLTVTAINQTKVYGDQNPTLGYTVNGYVNGEGSAAISGTPLVTTNAGAGASVGAYVIAVSSGSLVANNYSFNYVNGALTVTPRPITVNADAQTMVYGSSIPVLTYTVAASGAGTSRGLYLGDMLNGTLATTANSTTNVGAVAISQGTLTNSNNSNYNISYVPANLSVAPANLTVTGTQVYNGTVIVSGSSLTAVGVNGQSFTVGGVADLVSKNIQTNQPLADVNGLTLTPNGAALASNYNPISVANTRVSVTPLTISLNAPSITKVYDGGYTYNMTAADLATMSAQLVGGDTVSAAAVVFTGNNPNVGSNKSVSLNSATISDGNGGANYTPTLNSSATSRITAAPLTVTANNASKFVTEADAPSFNGVTYAGFVGLENASTALGGGLSIARTNASNNLAGSYAGVLVPSGLTANNGNYNITYVAGSYTIIPANQLSVQIAPATAVYGSAPSYTASAQYLSCSIASCPTNGTSVNVIHTLSPVVTGNAITVNDGAGGSSSFTITPVAASTSNSQNINVGGYQLAAANINNVSNNFSNTVVLTGALTVSRLTLDASQLGVSGISKEYNGTAAIPGLILSTSAANSRIIAGDTVAISGTGTYADANVGSNKAVSIAVSLSGADANNYALSNNQLTANIGTITQLASVTYTGASGGNWSNASNWAGGARPTLNNVANVVIPTGVTVNYDNAALVGLLPTSNITNNGVIAFAGSNNFTFANAVSGTGSINESGAGVLTITGNNSFTGDININGSGLVVGSVNALGSGSIISNGGNLSIASGITLPSLAIAGSVTLNTNVNTSGNQIYNGSITLGADGTYSLSSAGGNITFNGTVMANSASSFGINAQNLSISAPLGKVSFNDRVGASVTDGSGNLIAYSTSYLNNHNLNDLSVSANSILLAANITTFGTQSYIGSVFIGDNGTNGLTRILLSEDPSITFAGTINDSVANAHNLVVEAISNIPANLQTAAQTPNIIFSNDVGNLTPLASLYVKTGIQTPAASGVLITDISPDRTIANGTATIAANVTTAGNQTYISNSIQVAGGATYTANNGGAIAFLPGLTPSGVPAMSSIGNTPINVYLNGGSISGLNGSGVTYVERFIPTPAINGNDLLGNIVSVSQITSLQAPSEGLGAGGLMKSMIHPMQSTLTLTDGEVAASVSIKSPDEECEASAQECLKAQRL